MSISTSELSRQEQPEKGVIITDDAGEVGSAGGEVFVLNKDADTALKFTLGRHVIVDEESNKRVLRKIDWHLLPIMCALYLLQYLDKTALSYASIMGLQEDTNTTLYQYGWLGSIFYAGYLVFEYPHNLMLQKLPITKYIAVCIILWGAVLALMATCKNFPGLMVVRTFLGALEGAVTPGFILITARWYRNHEQVVRIGVWFTMNGIAQILGGAIAYGINAGLDANHSITFPGWKIVFITFGLLTCVFGIVFWFYPDNAMQAKWLTDDEKLIAIERLRVNQQGIGNRTFKKAQFVEALTDIRTWLYCLFTISKQIPDGGTTVFFSILIKSYGFTTSETLLLSMPGGLWQISCATFFCFLAFRTHQRALCAAGAMLIAICGPSLMVGLATPENPTRFRIGQLVGYYLTIGSGSPALIMILSMIATNCAGYTKKVTVNALNLIAYCAGFLIGPQIFIDAPAYRKAKFAVIGCWIVSWMSCVTLWYINRRENARRDKYVTEHSVAVIPGEEFFDLTDKQNPHFRYTL